MSLPGCLLLLLSAHGVAAHAQETGGTRPPVPARFSICFNHGCQNQAEVSLTPAQWQEVRALFSPAPSSPGQERERIARAVALLETLAGRLTGIDNDRGGSMAGLWLRNQMDCVDETTNTRQYLLLLQQDGLLKFHATAANARRLRPLMFQHYSAVIEEIPTREKFAVDSWFRNNGQEPVILPLRVWRRGWKPGDAMPDGG